jgi:hypothetical protein
VKRINIEESNEKRKLESNASEVCIIAKVVIGLGKLQEMCQKKEREKYKTL